MLKNFFSLLTSVIFVATAHAYDYSITQADDITYDRLVKIGDETGVTDYVPFFKEIFRKLKVRTFLEFGVGYSTKYFLDSSTKVISVEMITHGYGPSNLKQFLKLYEEYSNWVPIAFFSGFQGDPSFAPYKHMGSEAVYKAASYQNAAHKNYALIDDFYRIELNAFIKNLVRFHKIDVAFVNPVGVPLRSDLIELLFDKVPVIIAHHTNCRKQEMFNDVNGYSWLTIPDNYEEIHFSAGQGTTIWILKKEEHQGLTEALRTYANAI
jgi:hypothetical protein